MPLVTLDFFFLRDVYLTQSDNSNQTQVLTDDQHVNRNTRVQTRLTGNFVEKKMVARKKLGAGRRGWEAGC